MSPANFPAVKIFSSLNLCLDVCVFLCVGTRFTTREYLQDDWIVLELVGLEEYIREMGSNSLSK